MAETTQTTSEAARQFAEFIRTPEASEILRSALTEAIEKTGLIELVAGHPDEATEMIRLLAARSGDTKETVLLKALRLYELALDAVEKGNYLAILTPEDEIVREITGFKPAATTSRLAGR